MYRQILALLSSTQSSPFRVLTRIHCTDMHSVQSIYSTDNVRVLLPGHGTATDALWAKIPLITFPVRKMASRAAASFAAASGSGLAGGGGGGGRTTIVRNLKDYVQVM